MEKALDVLDIINAVSANYCGTQFELLFKPCVEAMQSCLRDEGIFQLTWCIDNIKEFYTGI